MIYVITTLNLNEHRSRPVGYVEDKDVAFSILEKNQMDLYEAGWYPFACVELIDQGIYPIPKERWFFQWDQEKEGYVLMEKEPPEVENLICFGLG